MARCPLPQGTEQKKVNAPVLSALNSTVCSSPSGRSTLRSYPLMLRPWWPSMLFAWIKTWSPLCTWISVGSNEKSLAVSLISTRGLEGKVPGEDSMGVVTGEVEGRVEARGVEAGREVFVQAIIKERRIRKEKKTPSLSGISGIWCGFSTTRGIRYMRFFSVCLEQDVHQPITLFSAIAAHAFLRVCIRTGFRVEVVKARG